LLQCPQLRLDIVVERAAVDPSAGAFQEGEQFLIAGFCRDIGAAQIADSPSPSAAASSIAALSLA
jgi:hypothetical protein